MILSWSRDRMWWFTTSEDRHHTFEGIARFFDQIGGVPTACRTDRMGALGRSHGRRFELHAPTVGPPCITRRRSPRVRPVTPNAKARSSGRSGRCRRRFSPEVEFDGIPTGLDDLNRRAVVWLDERVHGVESRTTGEKPADRLVVERDFLGTLPRVRFDSDYVEVRRVHNVLPFVSIDANRYSVPP